MHLSIFFRGKYYEYPFQPLCVENLCNVDKIFRKIKQFCSVSVIHPDILACGGALELKKIADIAGYHPDLAFLCINSRLGNMSAWEAIQVAQVIGA